MLLEQNVNSLLEMTPVMMIKPAVNMKILQEMLTTLNGASIVLHVLPEKSVALLVLMHKITQLNIGLKLVTDFAATLIKIKSS